MPPKLLGVLMTMRQASMRSACFMIFSFCAGWMYRDAVWPWPPSQTSFSALSSASSKSFAWYIASTGESFSCANSSESSTLSTSPMRIFVSSGTSTPASAAMVCALWPTIFAFNAPLIKIVWRT